MSLSSTACLLAVAALMMAGASVSGYENPLKVPKGEMGAGIADPGIIRWMGKYYLYATKVVEDPGLRCWESDDLVNWKFKGFCIGEDPNFGNRMAWNPAPFYYNGKFYLYVCSSDQIHRAFEADVPWGPFKCVNPDLIDVKALDTMPFLDDDGQLYQFYSGWGGIQYRKCSSPVKADGENHQLTECKFSAIPENVWIEGPTVYKKDGNYYLSYCGNDWIKDSYQVQTARAKSIPDLKPQKSNPLLRQETGPWVATGCNHPVIGPDLKSLWTIYHCRQAGGSARRLCLDKLYFDPKTGDLKSTGPTWTVQANPEGPAWWDDFNRTEIGPSWEAVKGNWKITDKAYLSGDGKGGTARIISGIRTGNDFAAEFNVKLIEKDGRKSSFGIILSQDGDSELYLSINPETRKIELKEVKEGTAGSKPVASAAIPKQFDLGVWNTIRINKQNGRMLVYFDDMLKIDTSINSNGGRFGFTLEKCSAQFGWCGYSNY